MSKRSSALNTIVNLTVAVAGMAGAYWFLVRPWHRAWGATAAEAQRALPGDDLLATPKFEATHAITVNAPVEQVWPWIVQIGKDRGGFYSYDWIENSMGLEIRSANRIVPELQNLKVGDTLPLGPNNFGPVVRQLEPNRVMVLHGDSRTAATSAIPGMKPGDYIAMVWTFYVQPINTQSTRLIERFKLDYNENLQNKLYYDAFLEPGAFVMERKMLLGIKERAERHAAPPIVNGVQS